MRPSAGIATAPPGPDRDGEKIGKLQDVYVDVEIDEPQFGTGRRLARR